jgi:hypothetical protein
MSDAEEAADAIAQLDGLEIAGRNMKVNVAKDRNTDDEEEELAPSPLFLTVATMARSVICDAATRWAHGSRLPH